MFGFLCSWFIGEQTKNSWTKTQTLPNLRLPISSVPHSPDRVAAVVDQYQGARGGEPDPGHSRAGRAREKRPPRAAHHAAPNLLARLHSQMHHRLLLNMLDCALRDPLSSLYNRNRFKSSHLSQRKSILYADLLNRPKFTLEGRIWALIYLLYRWFYFITGYFISGFYCIVEIDLKDQVSHNL